jgi:hypothetical protein
MLTILVALIALALVADGIIFVIYRDVLEPRVLAVVPNFDCGVFAAAEVIGGLTVLFFTFL